MTSLIGGLFGSSAAQTASQQEIAEIEQAEGVINNEASTNATVIGNEAGQNAQGINAAGTAEQQAIAQQAQNIQQQQQTQTANLQPYITAGQTAEQQAAALASQGFTAPNGITEQNDPGYQARLQAGQQALQRSAAATGNLLTGGTANALNNAAQNFASNEYGNVYARALGGYQENLGALEGVAGTGLSAGGTLNSNIGTNTGLAGSNTQAGVSATAGNAGQYLQSNEQAAQSLVQNNQSAAQTIASLLGSQGSAQAAGTIGSANALSSALSGIGNTAQTLSIANLLAPQTSTVSGYPTTSAAGSAAQTNAIGALVANPYGTGGYLPPSNSSSYGGVGGQP